MIMIKAKGGETAAEQAAHTHEDLEREIAALKKEVADLKSAGGKGGGAADPRVDKLVEFVKRVNGYLAEKLGL
jgi:hypothetical protein